MSALNGVIRADEQVPRFTSIVMRATLPKDHPLAVRHFCEHAMVKADGSCRFCNAPRAEVISAIARRTGGK